MAKKLCELEGQVMTVTTEKHQFNEEIEVLNKASDDFQVTGVNDEIQIEKPFSLGCYCRVPMAH